MKKLFYTWMALMAFGVLLSCSSYETYGEKKEKERNAINAYIRNHNIKVIDESQFVQQDSMTDVSKNEFVYLSKSGIYLQIERKGCGHKLEENKAVTVLFRFSEFNILEDTMQLRNDVSGRPNYLDKMSVSRSSASISGSFVSGVMMSAYGTSAVPNGFLVPFHYINLGRPEKEGDEIAKIHMIVPHSQGQASAQQYVYPCFYTITYERER